MNIEEILANRGQRYGTFADNAETTQAIKQILHENPGWDNLSFAQAEALEMIAHKMSRIVNGDANYADSWTDIIGYARLVEADLIVVSKAPKEEEVCTDPLCPQHSQAIRQALEVLIKAGILVHT